MTQFRANGESRYVLANLTAVVLAVFLGQVAEVRGEAGSAASSQSGDVMRGWRTFYGNGCVECHAIWGRGGRVGPDLGRSRLGHLSGERLAGVMWNHIPKMLGQMEHTGRPPTSLSREEMSDLFTLIRFVRQLDERGDPQRGERVLREKGCAECHSIGSTETGAGPDLAKWGRYVNPVAWGQMMWEHAPMMDQAMERSGMNWPRLEGSDLVHILSYVRSTAAGGERMYLRPGSDARGERLFRERKCADCHPGQGPDLTESELPSSIGALAGRMWNHAPTMTSSMRAGDVARVPVNAQELADILAYVLAIAGRDLDGDPVRGRHVFEQKGCSQCHEEDGTTDSVGPAIKRLRSDATPIDMAAAMWNHGGTMLEHTTEAGPSWNVFDDRDMVDLLAFLRESGSAGHEEK